MISGVNRSPERSPVNTKQLINNYFANPLLRSPNERHTVRLVSGEPRKLGKPLGSGKERRVYENKVSPLARGLDSSKRDYVRSKY